MAVDDNNKDQELTEVRDSGDSGGASPPADAPVTPQARRHHARRLLTRRNAIITAGALATLAVVLVLAAVFFYRSGRVDTILREQIVSTLAEYGIRAEVEGFETQLGARTAEIRGLALYDAATGAELGNIKRITARIRVEDLYALNLRRNVQLERLVVDGLELWVVFDEQGRTNFANIRLPEADPNRRILFSYSTAEIEVTNSTIHYNDERYDLAGDARNLALTIIPDNPSAPEASRMNRITLKAAQSTLAFNGEKVEPIDIEARARVDQVKAEINEIVLRSPLAEARLEGVLDDWRALRYRLNITSSVDLSEVGRVLQSDAALRGAGQFAGTVEGEGTRYKVDGQIQSDALAAANVRLKGLTVNARAAGDGAQYEAQGRAVAEILTAGDFRLSFVQLAGNVMGTGADFRWLGELRAAAARSGANSIGELIIADVQAEMKDARLTATASRASAATFASGDVRVGGVKVGGVRVAQGANDSVAFSAETANAGTITTPDARVAGAQVSDLRGTRAANGAISFSARGARAGEVKTKDANIAGVAAEGVTGTQQGDTTRLEVARLRTSGVQGFGAQVGSLNIAGVRLAIRDNGRIEGSSGDINAGTVAFNTGGQRGQVTNVQVRRPVFTVEPAGRYRVSADLSLGGGFLGTLQLGSARSSVVATNNAVALNNLTASVLGGNAEGNATIATTRGGRSDINLRFQNLDIGNLLAFTGGDIVPLRGATTGTVDLEFPGTDFARASGTLDATIDAETGGEAEGRTPVTGRVALTANRGDFRITAANLQAGASQVSASGRFSLAGDSDLALDLRSTDAAELKRVALATGLLPDVENILDQYSIDPRGDLRFNATVQGALRNPTINGDVQLETLAVNNRPLGALSANFAVTPLEARITDGSLRGSGGGSIAFATTIPRDGRLNGIALDATLERFDAASLLALAPQADSPTLSGILNDFRSEVSGRVNVTGLPSAAAGTADLRFGEGSLAGQSFDSIIARATFAGSAVNIETLDARFDAGRITASGTADTKRLSFDLNAKGEGVRLDLISALAGGANSSIPRVGGVADFTATLAGSVADPRNINIVFDARGTDVTLNGQPAGALTLTGRTEQGRLNVEFTTGLLGTPQVARATLDFTNSNLPVTISVPLNNADLTPLFAALLPPGTNVRVTGRATGEITASGNLFTENAAGEDVFSYKALRGTAQFTELGVAIEDVQLNSENPLIVQFTPEEITFERTRFTGTGTNILFGGTAAIGAGGRQNLTVNGDLNLRILNGLSPNYFVGGTSQVAVAVRGTFANPQLTGTASLKGASLSALVGDDRLVASAINGSVRFDTNRAQIDNLTGRLGGGRFTVDGGALLEGFTLAQFRVNLRGDNVSLPLPRGIRASADANLVAQGSQTSQLISGTVALRRAEYTENLDLADLINSRQGGSISESSGGGGNNNGSSMFGATTRLDIRVEGRDAVVIRNNLADAVASVSLQILGTIEDPLIAGRVSAARGTLTFRGERYEITRAFIDLPAREDANLLVNLAAEADISGYRVFLSLSGELSETARPQVTVRSDPALPQADVVALITTGQLATDGGLGGSLAGAGISTASGLIADTIINAPVQRATDRLFGLNIFEINPVTSTSRGVTLEPQLTVGRQVNRNLRVTYTTRLAAEPNQIVAVEYRISDRLSFLAQYEQGNTTSLGGRNNEFNFELRFRKRF